MDKLVNIILTASAYMYIMANVQINRNVHGAKTLKTTLHSAMSFFLIMSDHC